jgi:hypothetical protein
MTGFKGAFLCAAAAGVLLAAGQAGAQQARRDLSEQEVKGFFERMERDVTQAVRSGDPARVLGWVRDHVADGATFRVTQEIHAGDERKGFGVLALDKQDMLRFGRAALGAMSDPQGTGLRDYALDVEVMRVDPIGPNAATARTRFIESGRLGPAGGAGGQQRPGAEAARFEVTARCDHLIRRDASGDRLLIGMTMCEARTRL